MDLRIDKNVLLALMIGAASLVAVPAAAAAPGDGGEYFVEAKLGSTTISNWSQTNQKATPEYLAGYRWDTGQGKLGFELGYVDFGPADSGPPSNGQALFGSSIYKSHALKLGANYNFPLTPQLYAEPRAGLMRLSYTGVTRNFPNADTNYNETKTGHYLGLGLGIWVTPNFALSLNLDNHTAELLGESTTLTVFSIGLQLRF